MSVRDTLDLDHEALALLGEPSIQAARQQAGQRLRVLAAAHVTAEAEASFVQALDEWTFQMLLKALNSDATQPRLLHHMYGAPHRGFGVDVPGSRGIGGDNPDNDYIVAPLDGAARYELRGQRFGEGPPDCPIGVYGNLSLSMSIDVLDWSQLRFESDGHFVITLGPEAGDGRANHLQTGPDARFLLIREALADWAQTPCSYLLRRLDPPAAPPLMREQIIQRAARYIVDDVASSYWWLAMVNATPRNTLSTPLGAVGIGGLVTQKISWARLRLADDEAFVMTVQPGGARYRGCVLMDFWQHSLDLSDRTCSLSDRQSRANADGSFTYVVSRADPGVHNWLDPCGLAEPRLMHRWQGLPADSDAGIRGELIRFDALSAHLPADTPRLTVRERDEQLQQRRAAFLTLFST